MANAYQLISIEQVDGLAAALEAASNTPAAILASLLTVDGPGSGLNADLLDGYNSTDFVFTSSYTAADVLSKLITVDGTGSGLDADLFDGYNSDAFPRKAENATIAGSWTFSTGYIHGIGTTARLDLDDNFGASLVYGTSRLAVGGPMIYYIGGVEKLRINLNDVTFESGTITANGNSIWHAGNDGAGSTLDADLLDGQQGSYYQNAGNLNAGTILAARMPALSGDITTSVGAVATTLATVNGNVGSFGSATAASVFTVNAKGLITAASSTTITPAFSSITSTPTTLSGYGITDAMGLAGGTFTGNISIVKASPTLTINDTTYSAPSTLGLFRAYSAAGNLYFTRNTSTARDYATELSMLAFNGSTGVGTFLVGPFVGSNQIWHAGNGGAGSTLDADLLDAQQGSYYRDAGNLNAGTILAARMPAHTGDVTSSAASVALTLATVNGNVGSFGSATQVATFTVNAKGLTTAASNVTITPAWGSITSVPAGVTSLAALTGAGVVTATSTGVLAMRSIGVGGSTEIPDRAAADSRYLMLAGGTLSGYLTLHADPASAMQAATKQYVDTVASGLSPKAAVRVATTVAGGNITLSGTQTIDGVAVIAGNRVLVKNQTSALENGIYVCAAGAWSRSTDADTWAELVSAFVFVEEGTDNADTGWTCTVNSGGTLNTTAVTWVQFSGSATFTASTGITKVGSDFQLTGQALALHNLATNGSIHRTGSGTYASRTLTAPAAGITVTNGDGVAGNPTLVLANDLAAVEGLATTGIVRRTATDTWSASALVNADLPASGVTASTYRSVTVNAQGIITAGTNPTTIAGYGITDLLTSILAIDGATSGIDADLLDGQHGAYYQDAGNINAGTLSDSRLPSTMTMKTFSGSSGGTTPLSIVISDTHGATQTTTTPWAALDFTTADISGVGAGVRTRIGAVSEASSGANTRIGFFTAPTTAGTMVEQMSIGSQGPVTITSSTITAAGNAVWHAGNDGAASTLDADLLDGQHGSYYRDAGNLNAGTILAARMPALTGDATSSAGAVALTLATVNGNVGSFGSATQVATFTVNAKGLTTAASNVTITPAWSSITSKPTTISGFGITDAVDVTTNQSIAGTKTFSNNLIVSTATNSTVQQWQGAGTNFNLILSSANGATASTRSYRIALDYLSGTATNGYIDFFRGTDGTTGFLTFGTAGSERVRIDASGSVGIGTTSPSDKLHIRAASAPVIRLENDTVLSTSAYQFYSGSSLEGAVSHYAQTAALTISSGRSVAWGGHIILTTDTVEKMRITSTGLVGIGTSAPVSRLHLSSSSAVDGMTLGSPTGVGLTVSNADPAYGLNMGTYSSGRSWIQASRVDGTATAYDLSLQASGGSVGIGIAAPTHKLHVRSEGDARVYVEDDNLNGRGGYLRSVTGGVVTLGTTSGVRDLVLAPDNTERMRILTTGNVGIGTASPASALDVAGTILSTGGNFDTTNGGDRSITLRSSTSYNWQLRSTGDHFQIREASDAAKIRLAITYPNGYVGIGISTPTSVLELFNAATFNARTSGLNVHRPSSYGQYGSMAYDGDTTYFSSTYTGGGAGAYGAFRFWAYDSTSTPVDRFMIAANGNVGINITAPALQSGGTGLHIHATTSSELKFTNGTTGSLSTDGTALVSTGLGFTINNREAGSLTFGTSNTVRMTIDSAGDVAFGASAPTQKFGVDVSREQVFGVDTLGYVTMPHADASGFSALKAASGRGLKLMSGSTSLVSLPGSLASTLVLGYAALQIGDTSGAGTPIRLFSIGASDLVLRGGDGDVSRTADVIVTVKNNVEVARFADTGVVSFANTSVTAAGNAMWHAGNDGAGSGLDADLLDGQQGAYYFPVSGGNFTGNISIVKASPSITINDTTYVDPSPHGLFRVYSAAGNMYITRNTSTTRDYSTESSMVSISSSTGVWNFTSTPLVSGGSLALLASPAFTGTPTAPTAAAATNTTQIATTAFVTTADNLKANLASPTFTGVPAAPTAAAATNTTQIATTAFVTTADNLKANLASPTFTGVPAAPTAAALTNTTQLATTAFVTTAGNLKANIAAPSFTGNGVITSSSGGTATITFTISDTHTATQSTTVPWAAYDFTSADLSGVGAGIRCRIGALSEAASGANTKISFYTAPTTAGTLVEQMSIGSQGPITFTSSTVTAAGNAVWHAGNDGAASGLDADLLDGVQGASYALLASPALTGTPTAPTAAAATNTTQIATTAFVTTADNLKANLASPTFTGTVTMPAFSVTSDQKLKTSIEPLQGYGEFLDATKIYSFFKDGKHQFGVLAHEAQEVRPELVSTVPHDELGEVMTVNPMDYLFALVAEVQDLRKRVALLEGK